MESLDLLNKSIQLVGNIVILCLLVNVFFSGYIFKTQGSPYRRLFLFLVFNLLIEIAARLLAFSGHNNLPLLHLYTLGEFLLLSWFYKSLVDQPKIFQSHYWYFVIGVSIMIVLNSLLFQSIYEFNTLAKTIVQIIIISYAVLFFYNLTENRKLSSTTEKSLRLINSAVLIYYSGSLFIFMCGQISFENTDLYKVFWAFNALLNFIFQLLVLYALWQVAFSKTPSSS